MAQCLYESLRAMGLQHHYDRLTSVGVRSVAHLTVLTLDDFPLLGIQTMPDRTRLFHLIHALKSLDPQTLQQAAAGTRNTLKREDYVSSVCRKLDFHSENEPPSCDNSRNINHRKQSEQQQTENNFISKRDKLSQVISKRQQLGVNSIKSASKLNKTVPKSKSVEEEMSPQRCWTSAEEDRNCVRNVPVYQSNTAEYNYGLPQTSAPPTPSKRSEAEPRIWVCVRKRPLSAGEQRKQEADVVSTAEQTTVAVHERKEAVDLTHYVLQHRFYFDHVLDENCSNEEVYLRTARPLVQHMLNGGSSTCFAYGQTGAGKTHTMLGSSVGERGLYALAVRDIFTQVSSSAAHSRLSVCVSFFEIYCGQLYDLLDHRKRLFAREDGQRTVHISGLRQVGVDSVNALLEVICRGSVERSQGSSGVNPASSRSHALLQIQLREKNQRIYGRMWFVDLAGSERASDSRDPDRQSRIEGAEINQSLLALKECIRSLDQEQSHTPFRQSKLTQVLRDSFVGDSMTCMIANISPVHSATEHTLNTLRYANRVKELKSQGVQRRRRRTKNNPSPKQNLFQSLNQSLSKSISQGGGDARENASRGKSPPKRPRRTNTAPSTMSLIRANNDCGAFMSSTPKSSPSREDTRVQKMLQLISPVRNSPKQDTNPSQEKYNTEEWTRLSRNVQDQEKRIHLKLYHQHLQQLAPSISVSNTVPSSAKENMTSPLTENILDQYQAHLRAPPHCDQDFSKERWAWLSDKAENPGKTSLIIEDNLVNPEKRSEVELCGSRAPAERPLSPVNDQTHSILTLSALDGSPMKNCEQTGDNEKFSTTSGNPEALQEESCAMEPISCSMLSVDQQPATDSFLQGKAGTDGSQKEEDVGWDAEESYLEVPQAIGASMIPVVVQLRSQQEAENQTPVASESLCSAQLTSTVNDLVPHTQNIAQNNPHTLIDKALKYLLSKTDIAPPPGHHENSSRGEQRNENHSRDHWLVVQAHLETLKEMEVLSHKAGTLLIQQPEMAFVEYVRQLEEIMRRKAVCVRSLIAHLQPYLKGP